MTMYLRDNNDRDEAGDRRFKYSAHRAIILLDDRSHYRSRAGL